MYHYLHELPQLQYLRSSEKNYCRRQKRENYFAAVLLCFLYIFSADFNNIEATPTIVSFNISGDSVSASSQRKTGGKQKGKGIDKGKGTVCI